METHTREHLEVASKVATGVAVTAEVQAAMAAFQVPIGRSYRNG